MRRVFLVSVSVGLAGIERRFVNLWRLLRARGRVEPILVVSSVQARILRAAGLLPDDADGVVENPVSPAVAWLTEAEVPAALALPKVVLQSRLLGRGYQRRWSSMQATSGAVLHLGLPCSAITPPDMPAVYECVHAGLGGFRSRHFRIAARRRVVVHCQTARIHRALDATYAGLHPKWETVTNPTYFAHYPEGEPAVRDSQVLAFVGRLVPMKAPLLFIEAVAQARRRGALWKVLMLGDGPMRGEVEAAIRTHGLTGVVQPTFEPDAPARLAEAAVFASLQTGDNYGSQALLEAMGAGCAIVATNVGQTADIVTPEVGICVSPTGEAVADALCRLWADPEGTRARGLAAAHRARTVFSADRYAAFVESLYERAVQFHREEAP